MRKGVSCGRDALFAKKGGVLKYMRAPFYAQSPDFHKPELCYYPKFLYL